MNRRLGLFFLLALFAVVAPRTAHAQIDVLAATNFDPSDPAQVLTECETLLESDADLYDGVGVVCTVTFGNNAQPSCSAVDFEDANCVNTYPNISGDFYQTEGDSFIFFQEDPDFGFVDPDGYSCCFDDFDTEGVIFPPFEFLTPFDSEAEVAIATDEFIGFTPITISPTSAGPLQGNQTQVFTTNINADWQVISGRGSVGPTPSTQATYTAPEFISPGESAVVAACDTGNPSNCATANISLSAANFALTATPGTETADSGETTQYNVTLTSLNGFSGIVSLSEDDDLPDGSAAIFAPGSTCPGVPSNQSDYQVSPNAPTTLVFCVTTRLGAEDGVYSITITGEDQFGVMQTTPLTLNINSPDYVVVGVPQQFVTAGQSIQVPVSISAIGAYSGTIEFRALNLTPPDTDITATFNPSTINFPNESSTVLTITASPNAQTADVSAQIFTLGTESDGLTRDRETSFTLSVSSSINAPLTPSPGTQTVTSGGKTTYNITVSPSAGFSGTVTLSASGLPAKATASFSPASFTASGTSVMTIQTAGMTPAGTYPLTITASNGTLSKSTGVTLVVNGTATFMLSGTPSSQTVIQGATASYTVTSTPLNGFASTVALSVSGLPAGGSASLTPTSFANGAGSSTLKVTTASTTPVGTYTVTVTGTFGNIVASTSFTLVVHGPPDFTLSTSPTSTMIVEGSCGSFTVSVSPVNGFTGIVGLSVSGLPSAVTAGFTPLSISTSGSSRLNLCTSAAAPAGTYTLTIKATSGSLSHSDTVTLTVTAPPDFSLTMAPMAITTDPGSTAVYTATIRSLNSFTGVVTLQVSGLPAGATGTFSPASITDSGTSSLSIATSTATPVGKFVLTVTATSGSLAHTATISLLTAPQITAISPPFGPVGTVVTISGLSFGIVQGSSTLNFGSVVAKPTLWSTTKIVAPVPSGVPTGVVFPTVTVNGVQSAPIVPFSVGTPPAISSFSPQFGSPGTVLTVNGSGFGPTQGTSTITLVSATNVATALKPTTWNNTQIVAPIPSGMVNGVYSIHVTVGGLPSLGTFLFQVGVPPQITSVSPLSGAAGTVVTIAGNNFGATQGSSTVMFARTRGVPTSWSNTQIVVPVPQGAVSGNIVVTVGILSSNGVNFTVNAPGVGSVTISGAERSIVINPCIKLNRSCPVTIFDSGTVSLTVNGISTSVSYGQGSTSTSLATSLASAVNSNTNSLVTAAASGSVVTLTAKLVGSLTNYTLSASATTNDSTNFPGGSFHAAASGPTLTGGSGPTPVPIIGSISPNGAAVGTPVTIRGANFSATQGSSTVSFNGTLGAPTSWSANTIVVPVPPGATTGNIVITVLGQISSGVPFTVAPSISALTPAAAAIGTSITITGANFGATQGSSTVTFNGTKGTPSSWSAASVVVPVPAGATSGPVVVTVSGLASNGVNFAVGPTAGTGSVTISGVERSIIINPCIKLNRSCPTTIFDAGTISVTVNGVTVSVNYGQGSTSASLATALVSAINASTTIPITATASGSTMNMVAKTTGASTNYTLSGKAATSDSTNFPAGSFSVTASGSTLTGGTG